MKIQAKLVSVVGVAVVASLGMAVAQSKKEPVFVDSQDVRKNPQRPTVVVYI